MISTKKQNKFIIKKDSHEQWLKTLNVSSLSGDKLMTFFDNVMNSYLEIPNFKKFLKDTYINYGFKGSTMEVLPSFEENRFLEIKTHGFYETPDNLTELEALARVRGDMNSYLRGSFKGDFKSKNGDFTHEFSLFRIEVKRMINCCGAAVITNLSCSSPRVVQNKDNNETLKINIGMGGLAVLLSEILAYTQGYRLGIITGYNKKDSNLKVVRYGWKPVNSWMNNRTNTDLVLMTKDLDLKESLLNLEIHYECTKSNLSKYTF